MQEYVLGFYFSPALEHVVLIRKNRPENQAGKLNGIGGKIEAGESQSVAMVREYQEETGQFTIVEDWRKFAKMVGTGWAVHCFCATGEFHIESKTDEPVNVYSSVMDSISGKGTVANLPWLVPMAICYLRNANLDRPCALRFARIQFP